LTTRSIYFRYRFVIFAFIVLATSFILWGAHHAVKNNSNNIEDWLPPSFEETKQLLWFADEFGSDAFLMISWEGCSLEDPRAISYATELRKPIDLRDGKASLRPFQEVITSAEALDQMMKPPLELSRGDAEERLNGWAVGTDGKTSCVIAVFTVEGVHHRHAIVDHMYAVADRVPGLSSSDLRMAGSVVDSVSIDRASNEGLISLSVVSFSLCFVLMYLLFRSFLLAGMVFLNALFCQQLSLALIHFSGTQMDSVLLMVPLLVFVLVVSAGVHLANYYRDAVREHGLEGAPVRAVMDAIAPCWLASFTTALGLGSLLVSFLVPVRKFGTFACLAVVLGTVVLFLWLPAQLEQVPPRRAARNWKPESPRGGFFWDWILAVVRQLRYPILAAAILLTGVSLYGVFQLRASVRIHAMFLPESRLLTDYDWLEDRVGPLVPFEIILRLPKQEDGNVKPSMLLRMQLVDRVHHAVLKVDGIGAAVSAWNFCPPMKGLYGRGARQIARRSVFEKNLIKNRASFQEMALLRENASEELWRVTGRAYAGMGLDYTKVLNELRAAVDPMLNAANQQGFGEVTAIYCGGVPLVQKAQDQMMKDPPS
jgi:predicted RND superfamily exporter protein